MTFLRTIGVASVAAMLALGGAAFAQQVDPVEPDDTIGDSSPASPLEDATGFSVLGVDITPAGGSSEAVHAFVAGLSPEQQRGITTTCQNIVSGSDTTAVHQNTASFCQLLVGQM